MCSDGVVRLAGSCPLSSNNAWGWQIGIPPITININVNNLPCPPGQVRMGFTCDVPLNPTAQLVFSLVNQGGAPAFVNMMAVATLVVAGAEAGVFSYLAV